MIVKNVTFCTPPRCRHFVSFILGLLDNAAIFAKKEQDITAFRKKIEH